MFNRGNNAELLAIVNAYRAANGRAPLPESQLESNAVNRTDIRVSKSIRLGEDRRLELIAQVFNVFGQDNNGGLAQGWQENVLSDTFGRMLSVLPRQQGELAVRFVF